MNKLLRPVIRRPSLIEGASRIIDIGGTLHDNYSIALRTRIKTEKNRLYVNMPYSTIGVDVDRLNKDWQMVVKDMKVVTRKAISKYGLKKY